eukprot:13830089-Alexandrium_andersonii.AAC.1
MPRAVSGARRACPSWRHRRSPRRAAAYRNGARSQRRGVSDPSPSTAPPLPSLKPGPALSAVPRCSMMLLSASRCKGCA